MKKSSTKVKQPEEETLPQLISRLEGAFQTKGDLQKAVDVLYNYYHQK
jgi:hypothetical protein